jgi:hypothetical protein
MAFSTVDFFVKPTDGWVLVSTNPTFLMVQPSQPRHWRVAVTASGAPTSTTTRATGTLTLTANAGDTETVTIGGLTYTFQTTLVDAANNVLIGATASDSIDNLIAAIMGTAGAGTTYGTGTPVNTSATAAAGAGDTMDVTAKAPGTAGNNVATTETLTNGSFGAATLAGAVSAVRGIEKGQTQWQGRDAFRLDFATASTAEVYVRVPNASNHDDIEPMHFGVIKDE